MDEELIKKKIIKYIDKNINYTIDMETDIDDDKFDVYKLYYKMLYEEQVSYLFENINIFGYHYNDNDILLMFSFPVEDKRYRSKGMSNKIIGILSLIEQMFTYIKKSKCIELQEEKYIFLILIIEKENIHESS